MDPRILKAIESTQFTSITFSKNRITFSSRKPRRVSQEGDVKWMRGKRYVRRQRYDSFYKAYIVNSRGFPRFEWVQEDHPKYINPPNKYQPRQIIGMYEESSKYV